MEFRILGPVEAVADGEAVELGGGKLRTLLGLLVLDANRVVSSERLIEALWGSSPPETATNNLQVYVSQLRRAFREAEPGSERLLVTRRPGYVLRVDSAALDVARFERGVAEGRAALAAGSLEAGATLLREALGLWRGDPLEGADVESVALADAERLAEERLAALADRFEAELQLGRHDAVVGELEALAAANPLHERLTGQLILALYRAGRQADALEVYRRTRELLVDELGIEPGPTLHSLERAILVQDPSLDAPPREAAPAAPEREVRKTVTALAVAVGTGELDPEAARRVAARVLAELEAVAARYGGTVRRRARRRSRSMAFPPCTRTTRCGPSARRSSSVGGWAVSRASWTTTSACVSMPRSASRPATCSSGRRSWTDRWSRGTRRRAPQSSPLPPPAASSWTRPRVVRSKAWPSSSRPPVGRGAGATLLPGVSSPWRRTRLPSAGGATGSCSGAPPSSPSCGRPTSGP